MEPLSLTSALASAGVNAAELARAVGVDPSTAWRWTSTDAQYRRVEPSAAQLAAIGAALGLGARETQALAAWFALRARGEAA